MRRCAAGTSCWRERVPIPTRCLTAELWRLADPKISLASFSSLFLGTTLAAQDGDLSVGWLAVTVAGIFALEIAKNASGEIHDFAALGS